jgi:hypothetical protein
LVRQTLLKLTKGGGGPGFKSHGPHKLLNQHTNQKWGATWQRMTGPRGTLPFTQMMPHVAITFAQLSANHKLPHQQVPCHCMVTTSSCTDSATSACTDYTDCTVSILFFTCLTIQTDRDISRSRRPFEMKQIVLDS